MNVNFYYFNKRENSTAQPTGDGTVINCVIKDGSAVVNPTLRLKWNGSTAPLYNYAYIAAFQRYYFAGEWRYIDRQWEVDLICDVLATYKTNIGDATKYVLRSASSENPDAIDAMYPSTTGYEWVYVEGTGLNWASYGSNDGSFVITVVGEKNTTSGNNVAIYSVSGSTLQSLIEKMINKMSLAANQLTATTVYEMLADIMKLPFAFTTDVSQFLKNVQWFPFEFTNGGYTSDVYLGPYKAIQTGAKITDPIKSSVATIDLSSLIPAGTKKWEYMSPYASYSLVFPPFGMISLDPADVVNGGTLELMVRTDAMSGIGFLSVEKASSGGEIRRIAERSAQIGIQVPYGGWAPDYVGAITGIASIINAANAGEYAKYMLPAAIGSAVQGAGYQGYVAGGTGGGAGITGGQPKLVGRVMKHVDINPTELGYPLCESVQISTLSGFVQVQDGDITSMIASYDELVKVKKYLEGGFFYE